MTEAEAREVLSFIAEQLGIELLPYQRKFILLVLMGEKVRVLPRGRRG